MRSLPLEFSSDKLASQISDQFMFGEALLINPVTKEGAKERTLYLPAGHDWIDFWTGKRVRGGQSINAEAPLNRIPIYARAGSIIPFGPHAESTSAKPDPIELRIYAGAPGKFTLYEDQGDSYDYERGCLFRDSDPVGRQSRSAHHRKPSRKIPRYAGTQNVSSGCC